MSGKKRTMTVDTYEWDRLNQVARQYSAFSGDLQNLPNRIQEQVERDLQRSMNGVNSRFQTIDQQVNGLSKLVRDSERQMSNQFRQMTNSTTKQFNDVRNRINQTAHDLQVGVDQTRIEIARQGAHLQHAIDQERAAREQQMTEVEGRLDDVTDRLDDVTERIVTIEDRDQRAQQLADLLFADSDNLQSQIEILPHQQHFPGKLQRLTQSLTQARLTPEGMGQTALSGAQTVYRDFSNFHADVEMQEHLRLALLERAIIAINILEDQVKTNQEQTQQIFLRDGNVVALDEEQTEGLKSFDLAVDRWSGYELTALRKEIDALRQRFDGANDSQSSTFLHAEDLERILENELPTLAGRLNDSVGTAVLNYSMQRRKIAIAETVAEVLEASFYATDAGDWVKQDPLQEFVAKFHNDLGSEVTILVANDWVEINNYDPPTQPSSLRDDRAKAIVKALQKHGVPVGPVQTESNAPDPVMRDVHQIVAQGKPAGQVVQRNTAPATPSKTTVVPR